MAVVTVVSMKGGVGKTTVTTNLGAALASLGEMVLAVDLDPQNALRLHYGISVEQTDGVAKSTLLRRSWHHLGYQSPTGVHVLPFGEVCAQDCLAFERYLASHPHWLRDNLNSLGVNRDAITLIDTPPGPSLYLQQAMSVADLILVVLLTDAGSYSVFPASEALLRRYGADDSDYPESFYVLNQVDVSRALSRDIVEVVRNDFGKRFMPYPIHCDEAIAESLANQKTVLAYDRHSQATWDFERFAKWLLARLENTRYSI